MIDKTILYTGDCLIVLKDMPDSSVDSIVTDPPYGLSFMGKHWDYDVPSEEIWRECLRVLKPGGHLLAFAGTRTQHRMAVNIEDAGFEIRDMIAWVYGSGFPKSHNLKDDWQGWGTALKPAMEPITVARKPLIGTVAANVMQHGTGAINVDACRIPSGDGRKDACNNDDNDHVHTIGQRSRTGRTSGFAGHSPQPAPSSDLLASEPGCENQRTQPQDSPVDCLPCPRCGGVPVRPSQADGQASSPQRRDERAPLCRCATEPDTRDCLSTYEPPVVEDKDTTPHIESQAYTPNFKNKVYGKGKGGGAWDGAPSGRWPANLIHDGSDEVVGLFPVTKPTKPHPITSNIQKYEGYGNITRKNGETVNYDEGSDPQSAARFFYCAKASKADRDEGCEGLEERIVHQSGGRKVNTSNGDGTEMREFRPSRNHHPTVKPTSLMQYLVRLVTPPGGIVLDPFMGSGSTGKAAALEGFNFIGIEREAEYVAIAEARIKQSTKEINLSLFNT